MIPVLTEKDAAGSKGEKRSSGGHRTLHTKKRSHEFSAINSSSELSQYHAKTSDGPGYLPYYKPLFLISGGQ